MVHIFRTVQEDDELSLCTSSGTSTVIILQGQRRRKQTVCPAGSWLSGEGLRVTRKLKAGMDSQRKGQGKLVHRTFCEQVIVFPSLHPRFLSALLSSIPSSSSPPPSLHSDFCFQAAYSLRDPHALGQAISCTFSRLNSFLQEGTLSRWHISFQN